MSSLAQRLVILAAASVGMAGATPALADVVIVRSSGPSASSYPVGRRLPDGASVTLRANDNLVILGPAGTRSVSGPGVIAVGGPVRTSPLASAISARQSQRRSRIGAVRGPEGDPGLWDLDVARAGPFCARSGTRLALWRSDKAVPAVLTVGSVTADWARGQSFLAWPESVPLVSGRTYDLRLSTAAEPVSVRMVSVAQPPADPVDLAELFIRHGCQFQLERLLESVPH